MCWFVNIDKQQLRAAFEIQRTRTTNTVYLSNEKNKCFRLPKISRNNMQCLKRSERLASKSDRACAIDTGQEKPHSCPFHSRTVPCRQNSRQSKGHGNESRSQFVSTISRMAQGDVIKRDDMNCEGLGVIYLTVRLSPRIGSQWDC